MRRESTPGVQGPIKLGIWAAGETTISAFLNSGGGGVMFGVADGRAVGQDISDRTLREISGLLHRTSGGD